MNHPFWSFAVLLLTALPITAQPMHHRGPGSGPGMPRMNRLELTDAQEKQVQELRLTHQKKMIQVRSRIQEGRLDLQAAMSSPTPDRSVVEKAIRALSELQLQAKLERTSFWFNVQGLLTPEQMKVWREMPEKGSMMQRHGPPPGGCRGRCGR